MSSKHKHKHKSKAPAVSLPVLKERVERAISEGRFQNALDLARSLFKQDPSEAHRDVLRRACLGRAHQLSGQGYHRDACAVLESAAQLGGSPAFLGELAEQLAACGEVRRALAIVEGVSDPQLKTKVLGRAADAAIRQGSQGRGLLPEALQGQLDLIVRAFAQVEAGQDDPARETLQGIGLQSPFLEWKLLLRGLLAYHQNDDARAVENWQRLSADRWPARLAAPFRYLIDPSFRAAQPPATQNVLKQQADQLQGSGLVPTLRNLQPLLATEKGLPQAFRLADTLLEPLRREAPEMVPRLASCFYWAVIHHGNPEDVRRYQRVFGTPADDPKLARLEALALEHRDLMPEAHEQWQEFERSVGQNPTAWPGLEANRVRALVWWHMGNNADGMPDLEGHPGLPDFFRDGPRRPQPLKPSAEECYQKSLTLAADQLEAHAALIHHHLKKKQRPKAEKAARRLLKHFPDHVPTLETLGDLRMEAQDYAEAVSFFQDALKANPLERRLRAKLSTAHSFNARSRAEAGSFDEARAEYQAALSLDAGGEKYPVLCKWAACEFKAHNEARAEELLQQALGEKGSELPVDFSMLIETIRFKLPRALKTRFDKEVNRLLAEAPAAETAASLAGTVSSLRLAGVTYVGQKTHEKKVHTYLEKARGLTFTEQQLVRICEALLTLEKVRLFRDYVRLGQRAFPQSPFFYLAEAKANLEQGPYRCPLYQTTGLLQKARELATAMPRDSRQQALLEEIAEIEDEVRRLNPFAGLFSGFPIDPFDMGDEDEDDFEDEAW